MRNLLKTVCLILLFVFSSSAVFGQMKVDENFTSLATVGFYNGMAKIGVRSWLCAGSKGIWLLKNTVKDSFQMEHVKVVTFYGDTVDTVVGNNSVTPIEGGIVSSGAGMDKYYGGVLHNIPVEDSFGAHAWEGQYAAGIDGRPNGDYFAGLFRWSNGRGRLVKEFPGVTGNVMQALAFDRNRNRFFLGSRDGLHIYNRDVNEVIGPDSLNANFNIFGDVGYNRYGVSDLFITGDTLFVASWSGGNRQASLSIINLATDELIASWDYYDNPPPPEMLAEGVSPEALERPYKFACLYDKLLAIGSRAEE